MYSFPWVLWRHSYGCNQHSPYFPRFSQYVSTLFPNTESYMPRTIDGKKMIYFVDDGTHSTYTFPCYSEMDHGPDPTEPYPAEPPHRNKRQSRPAGSHKPQRHSIIIPEHAVQTAKLVFISDASQTHYHYGFHLNILLSMYL